LTEEFKLNEVVPVKEKYGKEELKLITLELASYYGRRFGGNAEKRLKEDVQKTASSGGGKKLFARLKWNEGLTTLYNSILVEQRKSRSLIPDLTQAVIVDRYSLNEPFAYATIVKEQSGQLRYMVTEAPLSTEEKRRLEEIRELMIDELDVDVKRLGSDKTIEEYLRKLVGSIVKNYKIKIGEESLKKIIYYLIRDFVYFDKIDPLMRDPRIEDISCNGSTLPLYVWHREYESIPTNVVFETPEELDKFIVKLTYMTGRAISIAQPVVDASLPDQSRIQLTYEKEVTRKGSSFTIRKFRERPLTITELMIFNTISPEMAAWFWYIIEKQASMLVVGGTACGKTTTVNMLSMFIKPTAKIVSIEDTAELQLPHENWLPSVVRTGFGVSGKIAEITLFDLLKNAMRQRPEYIIVGEVRGGEAYTLVQAIATGHGGLATLHADSVEASIHRLESEPMNIPRPLITTIDVIAVQIRVRLGEKSVRRISSVCEIVGLDPATKDILTNDIFKWDPKADSYTYYGRSYVLEKIMRRHGISYEEAARELNNRRLVLEWMMRENIRDYKDVVEVIRSYYLNPTELLNKIKAGT